jgi:hypothetical protein
MKVKIKKVHKAWNVIHMNEFQIGDVVELNGKIVVSKSGYKFLADDLCMCFGNKCCYFDIFDKIEEDEQPSMAL